MAGIVEAPPRTSSMDSELLPSAVAHAPASDLALHSGALGANAIDRLCQPLRDRLDGRPASIYGGWSRHARRRARRVAIALHGAAVGGRERNHDVDTNHPPAALRATHTATVSRVGGMGSASVENRGRARQVTSQDVGVETDSEPGVAGYTFGTTRV